MNMKIKVSAFLLLLLSVGFGSSIEAKAQAGGSAVPFLLISPDARASGRGETGTGIADDINCIYWNPAGLGFFDYFPENNEYDEPENIPFRQVALSFSPWLPQFNADLFYSNGTIGQYFESLNGTVAFNFIFMNLGEFTRTAVDGKVLGTFTSNEFSFGLSYGTIIAKDFAVGLQGRYIQSNLTPVSSASQKDAGVGSSVSFDLGALWKPSDLGFMSDNLSLGFNLQNVGPKITYISESDPLPTTLRLGVGYQIYSDEFNDLTVTADFAKLLVYRDSTSSDPVPKSLITGWRNPGAEWAGGVEYWYNKLIALRAGYFYEPSVMGGRKYWNFGAGIRYDIFNLDFSYINTIEANHPLANTMRFSMLINWK